MRNTIVINIAGGPGVGKTTIAAKLFACLKAMGLEVENVSEFAKELVWENRQEAFNDRVYMHGEQNHRLMQMNHKLDYIITDSPLFLTSVYNHHYLSDTFPKSYNEMIDTLTIETFRLYDNRVYLLRRMSDYKTIGRREDETNAKILDEKIEEYLKYNDIDYKVYEVEQAVDLILKDLNLK